MTDGGNTWTLIGNSGTVLAGARAVKVVVDPGNPNIAYVGVASGGVAQAPTAQYPIGGPGGPGVYKTTDGGLTWFNVLNPASMTYLTNPTNPATLTTLGAGAPVDSVTDLIIDPADHTRLFVGLGTIGLAPAAGTTGVWYSPQNSGAGWRLVEGGDNPAIANNGLPNELVNGDIIGRVTLAIGNGRTGNEGYLYVMVTSPPGNNTPPNVNWGSFSGLYRTKDNLLNFTKVMLKVNTQPPGLHNFVDISLSNRDAANAGAMIVDPADPNVVYIGASERSQAPGTPRTSASFASIPATSTTPAAATPATTRTNKPAPPSRQLLRSEQSQRHACRCLRPRRATGMTSTATKAANVGT